MNAFPVLNNPPSVEAIIELRSRLSEPATAEKCKAIASKLADCYPRAQELRFVTAQIRFGGAPETGLEPETSSSLLGTRLESLDGKVVIQAKADGLAVSRLAPYLGWADLRSTLESVWPIYAEIFLPEAVTRVGVRFLNRIDIGNEPVDLDHLFTAGPKVPPSLPQHVLKHHSQVVVPLNDLQATVSISQSSDISTTPSGPSHGVILDIDAFSETPFAAQDPSIFDRLENLRAAKNLAFFGSLTPRALERYK